MFFFYQKLREIAVTTFWWLTPGPRWTTASDPPKDAKMFKKS